MGWQKQIFCLLNLIVPIPNPDLLKSPYVHDDDNICFYTVLFFALKQTHCAFVTCGSQWVTTVLKDIFNI